MKEIKNSAVDKLHFDGQKKEMSNFSLLISSFSLSRQMRVITEHNTKIE
jgi:hypothetical protein